MDYKLKYLKYKNKYFNLKLKYLNIFSEDDFSYKKSSTLNKKKYLLIKDILTYSMNSEKSLDFSEQSNKNKYFNLKNNQKGGADKTILFGCTSLNNGSTFDENFDFINNAINRLIPISYIKHPYFVINSLTNEPKSILIENLKKNNYMLSDDLYKKSDLMQFINTEFVEKNKTIDVLILTGCNYFLTTITSEKFTYTFLTRANLYADMFALAKPNLYMIYKAINDDGYILNFYINKSEFINVEDFISPIGLVYILIHNICYKIFNRLFTRIENGIYRKNTGMTEEVYNRISDEEYHQNLEHFVSIANNKSITMEERIDLIIEDFIPKSYFKFIKENITIDVDIKISIKGHLLKFYS